MDWSTIYQNAEMPDFDKMMRKPDEWQTILAERIRGAAGEGTVLEAGSAYGMTSLLAGERARRTLLDLEPRAIEIASSLFATAGQDATFVVGDIFSMPFEDSCFDVVFNAGVLEHFDLAERRRALLEMTRVVKPGGKVFVAIPNHYSIPYRHGYDYRKKRGKWPYPDEEKIYDFSEELGGAKGVIQVSRETVAKKTMFYFLPKYRKIFFKLCHLFKGYEGYLTIITLEKTGNR